MIKLEDAFFGVMRPNLNHKNKLEPENLFSSIRVLHSVALWKTDPRTHKNALSGEPNDLLSWCFGDTRWRCEYEWVVSPWAGGSDDGEGTKVDVYSMYVEPNRQLLTEIVDSISVNSCREWLREYNKKHRIGYKRWL